MKSLSRLLLISRPVFWVGLISLFWWGMIFAGNSWGTISYLTAFYFGFPLAILAFGINDIADKESDQANTRKGGLEGAVIKTGEAGLVFKTGIFFAAAILALLILSGHYISALATLAIVFLCYAYSFKPIRLKSVPIIDSVSNGLWAVLIVLTGFYINDKGWTPTGFPLRLCLMFLVSGIAIHAMGALLDYDSDRKAGDKTIGTLLGKRPVAALSSVLMVVSFLAAPQSNFVLRDFYLLCALLCGLIAARSELKLLVSIKNLFFVIILIPLPALYLILR